MKKLIIFLAVCMISLSCESQSKTFWNNFDWDSVYVSGDDDEYLNIVVNGVGTWQIIRPFGVAPPDYGGDYFISPTGDDDTGDGSFENPWFTLDKVWTVVAAGDTVYCRDGTYYWNDQQYLTGVNGTSADSIKIWNYPDEIPIFTKSGSYVKPSPHLGQAGLIYYTGKFVYWKGIEITGYSQPNGDTDLWTGFYAFDADSNLFEQMHCHHNGGAFYMRGSCEGNHILNGDFHHNQDPYSSSPYGDADGMAIAWNSTADLNDTNWVEGCRFWKNSDDGIDTWAAECFISIVNCWSWNNGYIPDTYTRSSEGNGFKYGSAALTATDTLRYTTHCLSFSNSEVGFNRNDAECDMVFLNNIAYKNGRSAGWGGGFEFWWAAGGADYGAHNNIAYDNLPDEVSWDHDTYVDTNDWDLAGVTVTDADFVSVADSGSLDNARQADGSLPVINFLFPANGSDIINVGSKQYGMPYYGSAPDLGPFESNYGVQLWLAILMFLIYIRNRKKFRC